MIVLQCGVKNVCFLWLFLAIFRSKSLLNAKKIPFLFFFFDYANRLRNAPANFAPSIESKGCFFSMSFSWQQGRLRPRRDTSNQILLAEWR